MIYWYLKFDGEPVFISNISFGIPSDLYGESWKLKSVNFNVTCFSSLNLAKSAKDKLCQLRVKKWCQRFKIVRVERKSKQRRQFVERICEGTIK